MTDQKANDAVDQLIAYFDQLIPLNTEEKTLVSEKFHGRIYRRKQFVLQEGDLCNAVTFVISGCLRMYQVDASGTVNIIQFATENWWISDLGSFYKRYPSVMNIEAIETSEVLQINHEALLSLYEEAPKFNGIFRILMENNLVGLQERLLQNMRSDARERYQAFLKQYPKLVNRIPNTYIASFLGITPEFLSRIRNERTPR